MPSSKREPAQVMVTTFAGNTLLSREAWVWTLVGKKAVKKKAGHLKPNDLVLEHNTSMQVSLKDISEALRHDDLQYRTAHDRLHVVTSGGEFRTRLQIYLRNTFNLSDEQLADPKQSALASQRIVSRLSDFDSRARRYFGERKTVDLTRTHQTVQNWLKGETVLPSDFRVLRLLRRYSPEHFDRLFEKPRVLKAGDSTLVWAHRFWSTNHAILRRWVAGFTPKAIESIHQKFELPEVEYQEQERKAKGDLAEQRGIIYERLIKPLYHRVTREHAFIRVKKVKEISRSGEKKPEAPSMPSGVLVAAKIRPEDLGMEEANLSVLHRKGSFLLAVANKVLNDVPIRTVSAVTNQSHSSKGFGLSITSAIDSFDKITKAPSDSVIMLPAISSSGITRAAFKKDELIQDVQRVLEKLQSGELDKLSGLSPGTTMKIIQESFTALSNVPVIQKLANLHLLFNHIFLSVHGIADRDAAARAILVAEGLKSAGIPPFKIPRGVSNMKTLRKINAATFEAADEMAKSISAYGIPPIGIIMPLDHQITSKAGFDKFVAETVSRYEPFGITYKPLPQLPSQKEFEEFMRETEIPENDIRKLMFIFGRLNFIENLA